MSCASQQCITLSSPEPYALGVLFMWAAGWQGRDTRWRAAAPLWGGGPVASAGPLVGWAGFSGGWFGGRASRIWYWPFGRWGQFLTWLAAGSWVSQSWCWLAASGAGVPMEGGKPRVFLLCHLGQAPASQTVFLFLIFFTTCGSVWKNFIDLCSLTLFLLCPIWY